MDHALAVRVADRVRDRDHVREQRDPIAQAVVLRHQLLERAALDELHHVVRIAVGPTTGLVNRHDAGVLEPRGDQRLAHEPRLVRVVAAEQLLYRDRAAEPAIDRAHDPSQSAARVLCDLLVALRVVHRQHRIRIGVVWNIGCRRRVPSWNKRGSSVTRIGGHRLMKTETDGPTSRFP
jgi:hypothetical protein